MSSVLATIGPQPLGVVVGDERVERMRPDRQPDPDLGGEPRDPATGRGQDDARGRSDPARVSTPVDPRPVAIQLEGRDRRVLEDVDAALRCPAGVGPGDAVVSGGRAGQVMRGAQDRVAAAAGQVDLRDERLDLLGVTMTVSTPRAWLSAHARPLGAHRHLGVGAPQDAAGLVEQVRAGLVLERLVHLAGCACRSGPPRGCRSWRG